MTLLDVARQMIKDIKKPDYDIKEAVILSLAFYEEGLGKHFDITIFLQLLFECLVYYGMCLGMDKETAIKKAYGFFKLVKMWEEKGG